MCLLGARFEMHASICHGKLAFYGCEAHRLDLLDHSESESADRAVFVLPESWRLTISQTARAVHSRDAGIVTYICQRTMRGYWHYAHTTMSPRYVADRQQTEANLKQAEMC